MLSTLVSLLKMVVFVNILAGLADNSRPIIQVWTACTLWATMDTVSTKS